MTLVEIILLVLILAVGALQYVGLTSLARRIHFQHAAIHAALTAIEHLQEHFCVDEEPQGRKKERQKEVGH